VNRASARQGLALNLGCGDKQLAGFINVDSNTGDIQCDLRHGWPFAENSTEVIQMDNVLQYLPLKHCYAEASRILRPGGLWHVWVPHAYAIEGWRLGHMAAFTLRIFDYLEAPPAWFSTPNFKRVELRINLRSFKHAQWFQAFANISPRAWETLGLPLPELEWVGERLDNAVSAP